jgi:hypothetical protein
MPEVAHRRPLDADGTWSCRHDRSQALRPCYRFFFGRTYKTNE